MSASPMGSSSAAAEILFDKEIPCTIVSPTQEDRTRALRLHISLTQKGLQRAYVFRLTDDQVLSFLHMASMEEGDFPKVKESHHLNVDFNGFASFLTGFLEKCRSMANWSSRFVLRASAEPKQGAPLSFASSTAASGSLSSPAAPCPIGGTLTIIERDEFCDYPRYTMPFSSGTHAQIQEYLAGLVTFYRHQTEHCDTVRQALDMDLRSLSDSYDKVLAEREELRRVMDQQRADIESRCAATVNDVRSECNLRLEQTVALHEEQRRKAEDSLRADLADARQRLDSYMQKNVDNNSLLSQTEAKVKELTSVNESLHRQLSSTLLDCESLRKEAQATKTKQSETEHQLRELQVRESVLSQQVASGAENTGTLKELLETANARTRDVDSAHTATKEMLQRNEELLRRATDEILRANDIIKKKNGQIEALRSKVETKNQVCREQDARLTRMQEDVRESGAEKMRMAQQIRDKDVAASDLKNQLDRSNEELKKCKEMLEESHKVQQWLSAELNKTQMGSLSAFATSTSPGGAVGPAVAFTPPPASGAAMRPIALNATANTATSHYRSTLEPISLNSSSGAGYRSPADFAKITDRFLSASAISGMASTVNVSVAGDPDAIAAEYLPKAVRS